MSDESQDTAVPIRPDNQALWTVRISGAALTVTLGVSVSGVPSNAEAKPAFRVETTSAETMDQAAARALTTRSAVPSERLEAWATQHARVLAEAVDEELESRLAKRVVRNRDHTARKLGRR